jgi:hypothetical protein
MAIEKVLEKLAPKKAEKSSAKQEKMTSPEIKSERFSRATDESQEIARPGESQGGIMPLPISAAQDFQKKRAAAIDNILAEGLNEIFLKMDAKQQAEFKKKGEETVSKINILLNQTKIKLNKIVSLIRSWLKLIPGVNKFFLEREVKIKADKIIKLKDKF